jgi:hypothetical protein
MSLLGRFPGYAAANTYTSVAGGYAAALAAARASASDGDVYYDEDSGAYYVYHAPEGAHGLLITPQDAADAAAYEVNASGDAYAVAALDTEAEIVARGFDVVDGAGTVTGGGGDPLVIDGDAYVQFVPSTIGTRYVLYLCLEAVLGSTLNSTQIYAILGDGAVTAGARFRASVSNGSVGVLAINSGGSLVANTRGALTISGASWLRIVIDDDDSDRLVEIHDLDQDRRVGLVCETGDLITSTSKLIRVGCSASHRIDLHEFHILTLGAV